jgi:hypothetical protein
VAYLEVEGLPPGTRCTTRTRPLPNRKRWRRAPLPLRPVGQFQAASGAGSWARQLAVTECIDHVSELGEDTGRSAEQDAAASPERQTRQLAVRNCRLARRRHLQQEGALLQDQPGPVQVLPT